MEQELKVSVFVNALIPTPAYKDDCPDVGHLLECRRENVRVEIDHVL